MLVERKSLAKSKDGRRLEVLVWLVLAVLVVASLLETNKINDSKSSSASKSLARNIVSDKKIDSPFHHVDKQQKTKNIKRDNVGATKKNVKLKKITRPKLLKTQVVSKVQSSSVNRVGKMAAFRAGGNLISSGKVPTLIGKIDLDFSDYLTMLSSIDAKLVSFDRKRNRFVGEVRYRSNGKQYPTYQMKTTEDIGRYSMSARNIEREIPNDFRVWFSNENRIINGVGLYAPYVLFTREFEKVFVGSLYYSLKKLGYKIQEIDAIEYRYLFDRNLKQTNLIIEAIQFNGKKTKINYIVNLH